MIGIKILFLAAMIIGAMCGPRRLLDFDLPDCTNFTSCSVDAAPICGTDGHTYASTCEMQMENKKRMCWIGHFNMVMKVHDGACEPTTTSAMVVG